jgi:hypothetical protein
MHLNCRRVLLKEYNSAFYWMAGAVVLLAAGTLAYFPYGTRAAHLNTLWAILALLAVGWATTRFLKQSRRLRET